MGPPKPNAAAAEGSADEEAPAGAVTAGRLAAESAEAGSDDWRGDGSDAGRLRARRRIVPRARSGRELAGDRRRRGFRAGAAARPVRVCRSRRRRRGDDDRRGSDAATGAAGGRMSRRPAFLAADLLAIGAAASRSARSWGRFLGRRFRSLRLHRRRVGHARRLGRRGVDPLVERVGLRSGRTNRAASSADAGVDNRADPFRLRGNLRGFRRSRDRRFHRSVSLPAGSRLCWPALCSPACAFAGLAAGASADASGGAAVRRAAWRSSLEYSA